MFSELFTRTWQADVNLLIPWSNWLTPNSYPRRFDTMFFVAPIEKEFDDGSIDYCKREMSEAQWIHPTKVIERSSGKCKFPLYEL